MRYAQIPSEDEELAHQIIGAAIEVHRILGREFLESVYEKALEYELKSRGLHVARQQELVLHFKDLPLQIQCHARHKRQCHF